MKNKKTIEFITKIEFFYRNFGNEWNINDIINIKNKHDKLLFKNLLYELQKKEIVKIINDDFDFKIIDLPSNHIDLEK